MTATLVELIDGTIVTSDAEVWALCLRIRELFQYDQLTGVFTRRVAVGRHGRYRVGEVAGSDDGQGYRRMRVDGKHYRAHRLGWLYVHGKWPDRNLDHKNEIKSANGLGNLRELDQSRNMLNRSEPNRNNGTGARGVSKNRSGFIARITVDGQLRCLGTYPTVDQASAVYKAAKQEASICT